MSDAADFFASRPGRFLAVATIVIATLAAYANSFRVPFLFDDHDAIVENSTLENFRDALSPPAHGETVSGRPLLNLSFALNRAVGGLDVRGYHAVNLAIHLFAALTLFALLRITFSGRNVPVPYSLAFTATLLWALHPLQTAAVTYMVQRAESLAALLMLLTLYSFARGALSPTPHRWQILSVVACVLGLATKETAVVTPLLVLLYDRTFVAGSFSAAVRARRIFYAALLCTLFFLAALVSGNAGRGGTAGWNTEVTPLQYMLTQCCAVVRYLCLVFWPQPLVFDYGNAIVTHLSEVFVPALFLLALLGVTFVALRRRPALGLLAASFFLLLAPSSSLVPVATQTIAEHRMYLPLAAIATLAVIGLHGLIGRGAFPILMALSVALGFVTAHRNRDYRDEFTLWSDTVAKFPANTRAHINLSTLHLTAGNLAAALAHAEAAVRLDPRDPAALDNQAIVLAQSGHVPEAINQFEAALRLAPANADAHYNFANTLAQSGRVADALIHYETALNLRPRSAEFHSNFANALLAAGRPEDALAHYRTAVKLAPAKADFHVNLGNALAWSGQLPEAMADFELALRLEPNSARAHNNLGNAFATLNQLPEALAHYETAVRLAPDSAEYQDNLGSTLAQKGRVVEALPHFEAAVRLQPTLVQSRQNLATAYAYLGRIADAEFQFEEALRLQPDFTPAREKLRLLQSLPAPPHRK